MVRPAKVGLLVVVKCCPVLKARWVSVTASEPILKEVLPPKATDPPPLNPEPAVIVSAPDPVRLALASVPATSAVPKSTALVVEPEPMNIDAVRVLLTIASVTELAGRERDPVTVSPPDAVSKPTELKVPANEPFANASVWVAAAT